MTTGKLYYNHLCDIITLSGHRTVSIKIKQFLQSLLHSFCDISAHISETTEDKKMKRSKESNRPKICISFFLFTFYSFVLFTLALWISASEYLFQVLRDGRWFGTFIAKSHLWVTLCPSSLHNPLICLVLEQIHVRIDKNTELKMRHALLNYRELWGSVIFDAPQEFSWFHLCPHFLLQPL